MIADPVPGQPWQAPRSTQTALRPAGAPRSRLSFSAAALLAAIRQAMVQAGARGSIMVRLGTNGRRCGTCHGAGQRFGIATGRWQDAAHLALLEAS